MSRPVHVTVECAGAGAGDWNVLGLVHVNVIELVDSHVVAWERGRYADMAITVSYGDRSSVM